MFFFFSYLFFIGVLVSLGSVICLCVEHLSVSWLGLSACLSQVKLTAV